MMCIIHKDDGLELSEMKFEIELFIYYRIKLYLFSYLIIHFILLILGIRK